MKNTLCSLMLLLLVISCNSKSEDSKVQQNIQTSTKPAMERKVKLYTANVVRQFPHDPTAFTQGLLYHNGLIYESTGLNGESSIRQLDPRNGVILKQVNLSENYFGEGIALVDDKIYQLTWQEGTCFVYDAKTLNNIRSFSYFGEGWGLAFDGNNLIRSDGSFVLKLIDPKNFNLVGSKNIYYEDGRPAYNLNELELAEGFLWANVWGEDLIVKIDTSSSKIVGLVDISNLRKIVKAYPQSEVSNGIAYNPETKTFFLTGKYWPLMFEVTLEERK